MTQARAQPQLTEKAKSLHKAFARDQPRAVERRIPSEAFLIGEQAAVVVTAHASGKEQLVGERQLLPAEHAKGLFVGISLVHRELAGRGRAGRGSGGDTYPEAVQR